jgi:hypothetical protein
LGWAWWSAGPWWGNYMFTLEPPNVGSGNPTDRQPMTVLRSFIPAPTPSLVLSNNQVRFLTQAGFRYQPEASGDVSGGWTDYGTLISGSGLVTNVNVLPSAERGFYRIKVTRAP